MGFFDKLDTFLKKELPEAGKKMEKTISRLSELSAELTTEKSADKSAGKSATRSADVLNGNDLYHFNGTPEEYFEGIFMRYFPEYTIKKQVHMGPQGKGCVPVSFMFEKNGRQVLAIILCHSQEYNRKKVTLTMDECWRWNIRPERFFVDFRNKESYVCERIKGLLR